MSGTQVIRSSLLPSAMQGTSSMCPQRLMSASSSLVGPGP